MFYVWNVVTSANCFQTLYSNKSYKKKKKCSHSTYPTSSHAPIPGPFSSTGCIVFSMTVITNWKDLVSWLVGWMDGSLVAHLLPPEYKFYKIWDLPVICTIVHIALEEYMAHSRCSVNIVKC